MLKTEKEILASIGEGMALRIPFGRGRCSMVNTLKDRELPPIPVKKTVALKLSQSPMLFKLEAETKMEEYAPGLRSGRMGWRELGLDGENANFFVMTI